MQSCGGICVCLGGLEIIKLTKTPLIVWETKPTKAHPWRRDCASLKDDDNIQRQVKLLYCTANKLKRTLTQSSPVVNTFFLACCMTIYACQLWNKYTQTSMQRLRVAYNFPTELSISLHTQKCKYSPTLG